MAEEEKTAVRDMKSLFGDTQSPKKEEPCFIVIAGGTVGMMYKLTKDDIFIGRGTDAEIRVDDEGVSRKHARGCLPRRIRLAGQLD